MAQDHLSAAPSAGDESLGKALRELHDAVWEWNLETNEVLYSPAWRSMLGYGDELASHLDTWSTLCHPEDRERVVEAMEAYVADGNGRCEVEFRMRHADGRWRQILSRAVLLRDADGRPLQPLRLVGTHVDISAHAEVEHRLAHSLSLLRATFESTADGLLLADGHGRMEMFNERFAELWRLPAEILAGGDDRAALAFVLDQLIDPEGFLAKVTDLYEHPEAESFDVLPFKDGRVFERYSRPQRLGNAVVGRVWSFRDITAREQAIAALADQVRRGRALFEQSRDGIVVIDMTGRVHECNGRFAEMLGRPVEEVTAMHVWDWDATMPPEVIRERFLSEPLPPHAFRTKHRRSNGVVFDVEISTGNLVHDGQPQYLCTVRDITERLRAEEDHRVLREELLQAQKMDAIGQLTGGIAHEFNNMLGVILGYASLAGEIAADHDDRALGDYLASIRRAGENARDLVAKLLAFGRRRPVTNRAPQDAASLVESALRLLRPALPTSLGIACDLDAGLPAVTVDPMEFQQVIANLLLNASQATGQKGNVGITLRKWTTDAACAGCRLPFVGDHVALAVTDDGPGMSPEIQERIFEPFFTTKEAGRGTGLGLSVVHGIVHAIGGHLVVESREGSGSTFTVLLPPTGHAVSEAATPAADPTIATPRPASVARRFMVIDDQAEIADLLGQMLVARGHEARVFSDPAAALEAFRMRPEEFDAVISDQTMPGMLGSDLLLAIGRIRPATQRVIWTGYSDMLDEAEAARLGFTGFIRKPVTMDDLTALLQRLS